MLVQSFTENSHLYHPYLNYVGQLTVSNNDSVAYYVLKILCLQFSSHEYIKYVIYEYSTYCNLPLLVKGVRTREFPSCVSSGEVILAHRALRALKGRVLRRKEVECVCGE